MPPWNSSFGIIMPQYIIKYSHRLIYTGNCAEKGTRNAREGQTHSPPSPQPPLQRPRHGDLPLCQRSQGRRPCRIQIQGQGREDSRDCQGTRDFQTQVQIRKPREEETALQQLRSLPRRRQNPPISAQAHR